MFTVAKNKHFVPIAEKESFLHYGIRLEDMFETIIREELERLMK